MKTLQKGSSNKYKLSNHDINKFNLLLQKGIYTYEYIDCWGCDGWKKFNDTSFPEKDDFYSYLNMEDITAADYKILK